MEKQTIKEGAYICNNCGVMINKNKFELEKEGTLCPNCKRGILVFYGSFFFG